MSSLPYGWKLIELSQFLQRARREVPIVPDQAYYQIGIRSHGLGIFHKEPVSGAELGNKRVYWLEPGDFVLNIVFAWEGAVALVSERERGMCGSHRFPTFVVDEAICDRHFLLRYFQTKHGVELLGLVSPGGAGRNKTLNQSDFLRLEIPLPPIAEQRKIAAILSTWDEAIALTERLIAALQQRKQGLMQRLLTGQVRFPRFEGEWREVKFSDVLRIEIGGTPSRSEPRYWDKEKRGRHVWLSIADLNGKFVGDSKEYITDAGVSSSNVTLIPAETVIMSFKLTIGRTAITTRDLYTNEAICALLPKDTQEVWSRFLYHTLSVVRFDQEIDQAVKGQTLNKAKIRRLSLSLPSRAEQSRIAEFLDFVDDEIHSHQHLLLDLREQKKGLMQRLLTGEIRVKVD